MNDITKIFEKDNYLVLRNVLPKFFCDIVTNYAKYQAFYDFTPETEAVAQVPDSHSRYADFLMESILLHLQPILEKHIHRSLLPTYSYFRVYKQGDKLDPHVDRSACELSATVAFGWPGASSWPFKVSNDKVYVDGTEDCHTPSAEDSTITVNLEPGDILIYAGPKVKHWRDALDSEAYVQAFFHYVYENGSNLAQKFDGRDAIGVPKITTGIEYFKYSDWMNALMKSFSMKLNVTE